MLCAQGPRHTVTITEKSEAESSSTSIICVCVWGGGVGRVVLPERPWCVRAAKTPASLCALESAHPYKWTLFIYQRREMMKLWIYKWR